MQDSLFDLEQDGLSVNGIALDLGVSAASVRNWIKTGYLLLDYRRRITRESFSRFKKDVIGTEKLIARANKQFLPPLKNKSDFGKVGCGTETLSAEYENSLSAAYRNQEGIFYTPGDIADDFFQNLPADRANLIFCDPCCGSGQFLIAAIRAGFSPNNIYGFDTDTDAVAIAKQRLSQFPGFDEGNVVSQDFLSAALMSSEQPRYDVIMTNPPWGKKLPKTTRETVGKALHAGKSVDTCSLFFAAALKQLRPNGYCGFLLPGRS